MFDNIGGKIKGFAVVSFIIEAIASIITGIALGSIFLLIIPGGIFFALVVSWFMYGFGELIEQQTQTNDYLNQIGDLITALKAEKKNETSPKTEPKKQAEVVNSKAVVLGCNEDKVATVQMSEESGYIICSLCGLKQPINRTFCWTCGAKFDKEEKQS